MQPPGHRVGLPRDDRVAVDDGTAVLSVVVTLIKGWESDSRDLSEL